VQHIQSALAYPTTFFADMPTIRNFFAHRNKESAYKVLRLASSKYALGHIKEPHDFLRALLPQRPTTLMLDWIDDLKLIAHAMCY
jgi:hypothetical protein